MSFQSELFQNTDDNTKTRLEKVLRNAPPMRVGEKHQGATRAVQQGLTDLGFGMPYGVDGIFGMQTRHAVQRFQRQEQLTTDGIVGSNTLRILDIRLSASSLFQIQVRFIEGLTDAQQEVFSLAAERWSQIISADVPAFDTPDAGVVDDLLIDASGVPIDGVNNVLGQAGPTHIRPGSLIPVRGIMQFDSADLQQMEDNGSLVNVIIHEMGHVLGIGTLWSQHGLIEGSGSSDPLFNGVRAMEAYGNLLGSMEPTKVPVANTGGAGTREGHWRENVFSNELMTGFLNAGFNPISRLTIASLQDIGYDVNLAAADAYALPSALQLRSQKLMRQPSSCQIQVPECTVLPENAAREMALTA